MSYYFVIVGHHDNPVFELEYNPKPEQKVSIHQNKEELHQERCDSMIGLLSFWLGLHVRWLIRRKENCNQLLVCFQFYILEE